MIKRKKCVIDDYVYELAQLNIARTNEEFYFPVKVRCVRTVRCYTTMAFLLSSNIECHIRVNAKSKVSIKGNIRSP